jgi:pyrrolidone-carboxylate peptidase
LADNRGVIRDRSKIEKDGPEEVSMPFPVKSTLGSLELSQEEAGLTRLSDDPGAFVCNNTAYRMARHFSKPELQALYTFIHVPNHRCEDPELNTEISGSVIAKVIRQTLK